MYTRFRRVLSYIILGIFALGFVRVIVQSTRVSGLLKEVGLQAITFVMAGLVLYALGLLFKWLMARRIEKTGRDAGGTP